MMNIKIGDIVEWLDSSYIVIEIKGNSLLLKQNFSIGTTLTSMININEVTKI